MKTSMDEILQQFTAWMDEATAHPQISEPTAMCLATANASGAPSARMVLLKAWDARGFAFYTNIQSRKSHELRANMRAALCLYWMPLKRQIRVEGIAEALSGAEADKYFASRSRDSRIGAWASEQSAVLPDRATLEKRFEHYAKEYEGRDVPRPPFWAGWRVVPQAVEFWQEGPHRLHQRDYFTHEKDGSWKKQLLYP